MSGKRKSSTDDVRKRTTREAQPSGATARRVRAVLEKTLKKEAGEARREEAVGVTPTEVFEQAALRISAQIHFDGRHCPHGTIMDPVFAGPTSAEILSYTRAADSAIWTGHYLAAEAYRYQVTRSGDALNKARLALKGICGLVEITGTGVLARVAVPKDSPYLKAIVQEEGSHGVFEGKLDGRDWIWIGNTSRDQYSGLFFGLAAAYDLVDDAPMKEIIRELITRLLTFLLEHHWAVVLPNGRISTVFVGRPDQQLALLQIGRHVAPARFQKAYESLRDMCAVLTLVPIAWEVLDDHNSYFKFNLDSINLFNLIRLEKQKRFRAVYLQTYKVLRRTTDDHGNAHFNMIDRELTGPDARRDSETIDLLAAWLRRPRRDDWVDLTSEFSKCGEPSKSCVVIPVEKRVRTDFLWQRSPFLMVGGGKGTIEGPGIDFILPYWMARYYGVL